MAEPAAPPAPIPALDRWDQGDPYERYIGRLSRRVAPLFLQWLAAPPASEWVDVGCGTGALSAAILDHAAPASLAGVEPSEGFLAAARRALGERARWLPGTAAAIPLPDASADVVVSALMLNFVPDVPAALREMARLLRPGGRLGGYVWDYAGRMEPVRLFWDTAQQLDPQAAALHEGLRFPLCTPEALCAALGGAGFRGAEVVSIDLPAVYAGFDEDWLPFLGGQGPAPSYVARLDDAARRRLREQLHARVAPRVAADGSLPMVARAWAFRARPPA